MSDVKKVEPLSHRNICNYKQKGSFFLVTVSPDVCVQDLLDPAFWAHVSGANFLGDCNIVYVTWEDGAQFAQLYVREYQRTSARMELILHSDFRNKSKKPVPKKDGDKKPDPKFRVFWAGPNGLYRVIRISDDQVMMSDIKDKDKALAEMEKLEISHS